MQAPPGLKFRHNCVCIKCWEQASSKCPSCRSVFLLDRHQYYAIYDIYEANGKFYICTPVFPSGGIDLASRSIEELFALRKQEGAPSAHHPSWKQLACEHKWVFAPGCKSTIGCDCGLPAVSPSLPENAKTETTAEATSEAVAADA